MKALKIKKKLHTRQKVTKHKVQELTQKNLDKLQKVQRSMKANDVEIQNYHKKVKNRHNTQTV